MKRIVGLTVAALLVGGIGGMAPAYDGGSKMIVTMAMPEKRPAEAGPAPILYYDMTGSKAVVNFLRRIPEPTLSVERIRLEKPGQTSGTKAVVLFQEKWQRK